MGNAERKCITVAIYSHPELYPPVLNVIDELADVYNQVQVISRNLKTNHWQYPVAVRLLVSGKPMAIRDSEQASIWWKMNSFLRFTRDFYKALKREKQQWIMCNDPIALYSFRLVRPFLDYRVKLWYHNHDVTELTSVRKYSVGYFAVKSERKYFDRIDLFTLPSEARLSYFPLKRLKGKWLIVPNYPSLRRMGDQLRSDWNPEKNLKLLYQGHIGDDHGLEEIIAFVKTDSSLQLTIVGPGNGNFIRELRNKIVELGIKERVAVLDPVPYSELPQITKTHHVGLAVHEPVNIAFRTAALASNKIYEYAASGLPVIYYRDEHYIRYLGKYNWCFPTNLSVRDLSGIIQEIKTNFSSLSQSAQSEFQTMLNFGAVFHPVLAHISGFSACVNL